MDPKTAKRTLDALWWLIEKETCPDRRRLHIDRLLDIAPLALETRAQQIDRGQLTQLVQQLRKTG